MTRIPKSQGLKIGLKIIAGILLRIVFALPIMLLGYIFQLFARFFNWVGILICKFAVGILRALPFFEEVRHWQAMGEEVVGEDEWLARMNKDNKSFGNKP